jgi:hypothetical protein
MPVAEVEAATCAPASSMSTSSFRRSDLARVFGNDDQRMLNCGIYAGTSVYIRRIYKEPFRSISISYAPPRKYQLGSGLGRS